MIQLSAAPRAFVILAAGSWGGAAAKPQNQSPQKQLSPRSGRQHKAWGGAQRNPRIRNKKKTLSSRSGRKRVRFQTSIVVIRLSAASRASVILDRRFLGFRCAPPPGFMLSAAPRARFVSRRVSVTRAQALRYQ